MQLPYSMEPQLHAQIGTEAPVNHFPCTLRVSICVDELICIHGKEEGTEVVKCVDGLIDFT